MKVLSSKRLGGIACGLIVFVFVGCGGGPSEAVIEAKGLMQLNKPQDALDVLRDDRSAEALYLRALALEHLESRDIAKVEIQQAIEKEPENTKYRGFLLRLELFRGQEETANSIIELYKKGPASGATSIFAVYAFEAKSARARSQKSADVANVMHAEALKALKTAIALNAETPEFHPEMLVFAMRFREAELAEKIIKKLEQADPDNLDLTKERINVAFMLNKTEEAVGLARKQYRENQSDESNAMRYATVLSKSPATPQYDEAFTALREKFPTNTHIISRHAIYLTLSNRLLQACEMLNEVLNDLGPKGENRSVLVSLAIDLPMEAGSPVVAERQLELHRPEIFETPLASYFDGRLAYLRKDYDLAGEKMVQVIEAQKNDSGTSRALARDALLWARRIMADKMAAQSLQQASETIKTQVGTPKTEVDHPGVAAPEETKKTEATPEAKKEVPSEDGDSKTEKPSPSETPNYDEKAKSAESKPDKKPDE